MSKQQQRPPPIAPAAAAHDDQAPPFSPTPARENRHTASRPPSLLLGAAQPTKSSTSVVASTGLSLAGLPSSPSPYLLRSPDGPDYFSPRGIHGTMDRSGGDSPLFMRRAQAYQGHQGQGSASSADSSTGDHRGMPQPISFPLSSLRQRRPSNGSVSTASSSSPPLGATSIMAALRRADPDESGTTADSSILVADLDSPPPERSVSFAPSANLGPVEVMTPEAQLLRSSQRSTGSVRSTFSERSVRSSSVDVDVGTPFPSDKRAPGPPKRLTQPTVIRSTSGRGIMFVPRTTEAAPVSSAGRPASFSGHVQSPYGLDIARNRTSLPMSPSAMKSRATSSLAGVLAATATSPHPSSIPDRLDPGSPDKHSSASLQHHRRRNSNKSLGASSTNTSGSEGSSNTVQSASVGSGSAPRRTNSQSSLRTRFTSARAAAPEAVVTATSVSTSLAGGRHSLQHHGVRHYPMSHPQPESSSEQQSPPHATSRSDHGPISCSHEKALGSGPGDHHSGRPWRQSAREAHVDSTEEGDAAKHGAAVPTATANLTVTEAGCNTSVSSGVGIATAAGPPVGKTTPRTRPSATQPVDATEIRAALPGISPSAISISPAPKILSQAQSPQRPQSLSQTQSKPLRETETMSTLPPAQQIRVTQADEPVVPDISSTPSSTTATIRQSDVIIQPSITPTSTPPLPPPPPTRTVSTLAAPRKDDMNSNSMHIGPSYHLPSVDDFSPHAASRSRGKKPASWHAKSDSEGETELHEVDEAPTRTTTVIHSASASATLGSSSSSRDTSGSRPSSTRQHSNSNRNSHGVSSGSECSPQLGAVDDYAPPYAVRKSSKDLAAPYENRNHKSADANHASSSKRHSPKAKDRQKAKAKAKAKAKTQPKTKTTPTATTRRPEPFTLTLAASLASSLPLPFDRRHIELIVSWSAPEGLWQYIPFAKYIPAWGVHVAGPRARMWSPGPGSEVSVQTAFELRGLVREFVASIPLVGRFAAWF